MAERLIPIDEAAAQLGISKDRMNELREEGHLRAYRDQASWKFRAEDIERMAAEGVPTPESEEDLSVNLGALGMGSMDSLDSQGSIEDFDLDDLRLDSDSGGSVSAEGTPTDELELDLTEATPANMGRTPAPEAPKPPAAKTPAKPAAKELEIEPLEDDAESILMSEAELGDLGGRPPSTIIGRPDPDDESDLKLAGSSAGEMKAPQPAPATPKMPSLSDVKLASSVDSALGLGPSKSGGESAAASASPSAGSIGGSQKTPSSASSQSAFDDIDELEIDLEVESSKIMSGDDVSRALEAARNASSFSMAGEDSSGQDLELLEPGMSSAASADADFSLGDGGSSVVLTEDEEDDFVLGGTGSRIGMSAAESGINLNPSDSGIALDDVPLEISGASAGGSFDLGGSLDIDASGESLASGASLAMSGELASGEDFLLTPLGEAGDGEDSSQVIALEPVEEDEAINVSGFGLGTGMPSGMAGFGATGLSGAGLSGGGGLSGAGLSGAGLSAGAGQPGDMAGIAPMGAPAAAISMVPETRFDPLSLGLLAVTLIPMVIGAMVVTDLIRSMWSYEEPFTITSSLIEGIQSLAGS